MAQSFGYLTPAGGGYAGHVFPIVIGECGSYLTSVGHPTLTHALRLNKCPSWCSYTALSPCPHAVHQRGAGVCPVAWTGPRRCPCKHVCELCGLRGSGCAFRC